MGADFESLAVRRAGDVADEPVQQRFYYLLVGSPVFGCEFVMGCQVCCQSQRQWLAAGEGEQRRILLLGHSPRREQRARLFRVQTRQCDDPQGVVPVGIGAPGWVQRQPASDGNECVDGQSGQETGAQPVLQRLALLERVDHQHHTVGCQGAAAGGFECGWGWAGYPEVHLDHGPADHPGVVGEYPQQGRFPPTARTVDVQHREAALVVLQSGTE